MILWKINTQHCPEGIYKDSKIFHQLHDKKKKKDVQTVSQVASLICPNPNKDVAGKKHVLAQFLHEVKVLM